MGTSDRFAPSPTVIEGLLGKGWIEQRGGGNEICYRVTDEGFAAETTPVRIHN
jgi:hypothetical protein